MRSHTAEDESTEKEEASLARCPPAGGVGGVGGSAGVRVAAAGCAPPALMLLTKLSARGVSDGIAVAVADANADAAVAGAAARAAAALGGAVAAER
jgi:hypothetical protein